MPEPAPLDWSATSEQSQAELYLELLKRVLTGLIRPTTFAPPKTPVSPLKRKVFNRLEEYLHTKGHQIVRRVTVNMEERARGREWIPDGETMVGLLRLNNVQQCIHDVVRDAIPGDLIETGVWRGGTCILMRACLQAYGDTQRRVWLADSFQGLPPPDADKYPADAGDLHATWNDVLAISRQDVEENFRRYGLLDERVCFLEGWFRDTLPTAPIDKLAVLRLDGDMYESTMDALTSLYPKLSPGGFAIIDDYLWHKPCAQAVEDYRLQHGITEPVIKIDGDGVYWRRER